MPFFRANLIGLKAADRDKKETLSKMRGRAAMVAKVGSVFGL
jgi:hypothetical protein